MENSKIKAAGLCTITASKKLLHPHDTSIVKRYATPESCPKFQACNAPICPCDSDWHKRSHLNGDKCCMYLLESAKPVAKAIFSAAGLGELYAVMVQAAPDITARYSTIRLTYERAKQSGSRMARKFGGCHAES